MSEKYTEAQRKEFAELTRRMVIGCIISEYSLLELKGNVNFDLKNRVNVALNSIKRVQEYFLKNPVYGSDRAERFKKEFFRGQNVLIGELVTLLYDLQEEDLEEVINAVKTHRNGASNLTQDSINSPG